MENEMLLEFARGKWSVQAQRGPLWALWPLLKLPLKDGTPPLVTTGVRSPCGGNGAASCAPATQSIGLHQRLRAIYL